jgi:hypothetical protein
MLGILDHHSEKDSNEEDGIHDGSVTLEGRIKVDLKKPEYAKKIIRL